MSQSGANYSLNGGVATTGFGFTSHAVRFRTYTSPTGGFIFENSSNENLFSIRGSDGYGYLRGDFNVGGIRTKLGVSSANYEMDLGYVDHPNWTGIRHGALTGVNKYSMLISPAGRTMINAVSGQRLDFNYAGASKAGLDTDGTFHTDGGGARLNIMNGEDDQSTTPKGIYLWDETNSNWGIYMSQSGANRSLSGGVATAGLGFTSHAVRFRTAYGSVGFIFENHYEQNLFSIRGLDGYAYFKGTLRVNSLGAGTVISDANGVLSVSSDERLKNITDNFSRGLNEILQIQPINYHWTADSGLDTENSYSGFSAQNVQANIPEAVGKDNRGYLTLSDRPITAALVNSVKELKAENDTLKAENEDLKARLAKIEQALGLEE